MPAEGSQVLSWAGERWELLAERALWWPAARTLLVADLHLGKAASFRVQGLPVPAGTTQDNLQRLDQLLQHHAAQRLVFLGDFLHAAQGRRPEVLAQALAWRERHAALQCVLVRGNHDLHAGRPPQALDITVVDEPWPLAAGLAACHHPQQLPGQAVLAGHWHPVVRLRGPGGDAMRLPCFSVQPHCLVLPAFGAFTGGSSRPVPSDASCFPVGAGRVWRGIAPRRA